MYMNTKKIGDLAEEKVCEFLKNKGFKILQRNYRVVGAEVDIIACNNNSINFIEVKKIPKYYDGVDIAAKINKQKIVKIKKAASVYLALCSKIKYDEISFDVAIVTEENVTMFNGAF